MRIMVISQNIQKPQDKEYGNQRIKPDKKYGNQRIDIKG